MQECLGCKKTDGTLKYHLCSSCSLNFCIICLDTCVGCEEHFCRKCNKTVTCDHCEESYCVDCILVCDDAGNVCEQCADEDRRGEGEWEATSPETKKRILESRCVQ